MLRSNVGRLSFLLAVILLACLVRADAASEFTYYVDGYVYYNTGGAVPNAVVEFYIHWPDGMVTCPGAKFADLTGYFWFQYTITGHGSSCQGWTFDLKASNGIKTWTGSTTWVCQYLSETKNVTVYNTTGLNPEVKAAVHVMPHASRTCAKNFPAIADCADITTSEASSDVDAFPVFYDLLEYQGVDYGMIWSGTHSCAFTSCSDLTIGDIVYPGDGISHAWATCMSGPVAIPGWGWIYGSGMVCLLPHPGIGGPAVGDCDGEINYPMCSFCAGIGGYVGDDPCEPTSTQPTSWGAIKAIFK